MNASSFVEYATSDNLDADETYIVELLIERVRSKFDPHYWDTWSRRSEARNTADYQPVFSQDHVRPAETELKKITWLSFQRISDTERPVRDISALRFLPELATLILARNEVTDLMPLRDCKNLKELNLWENPSQNISPLVSCANLEKLELGDTPVEDASFLGAFPNLRSLSISIRQAPSFKRPLHLPVLRKLELRADASDSFDEFPLMPELRIIQGGDVGSLSGIQRFPKLENLVNLFGSFDSLVPLAEARLLTHANILRSHIRSLEPLSRLFSLRSLWLSTENDALDLRPLERLPCLHQLTIQCAAHEPPALEKLRSDLLSWDVEFRSAAPRYTPFLELQIVDQDAFDHYDTRQPYGLDETDTNESMLASEVEWLDQQIEEVFAVDFQQGEDYTIPFRWGGARSRTVVLLSEQAVAAFSRLVLGMQNVLCHANKGWIIYFQSDEVDPCFVTWVYPEKIMVTEEYAETVRSLIAPR